MKIGIGFYMGGVERDGIGWSITHLVQHLLRTGSSHTFVLFTNLPVEAIRTEFQDAPNLKVVAVRAQRYTVWEQIALPRAIKAERPDVFHSPLGLPLLCSAPGIATIHDLCFLTHPETFTSRMRLYFRVFLPLAARKARIVATDSLASKKTLMELLRVPEGKIRVVPNGIAEDFKPVRDPDAIARVREKYRLPERFILYVGTIEPRKNVLRLLQAYQRLWKSDRVEEKLVIVGKRGWLSQHVFEFLETSGVKDRVVYPGYVARQDLPVVYSASTAFIYPSLCEGFGLPPLEAMACGVPVVASNTSSLPEILGSAAYLVDPLDVDGLAGAIRQVLTDGRLQAMLRERGLERTSLYHWDTAARRVMGVYEEVAGRRR